MEYIVRVAPSPRGRVIVLVTVHPGPVVSLLVTLNYMHQPVIRLFGCLGVLLALIRAACVCFSCLGVTE